MTENFLAPCWAKVHHAERHLLALQDAVSAYLAEEPFEVVGRVDLAARAYVANLSVRKSPPVIWSLIAGDAVANLRAALDHAVCCLVEKEGHVVGTSHAFPILDECPVGTRKKRAWDDKVRGVGADAERIIELSQPFMASPDDPARSVLHALRELSNEDKHRILLARFSAIPGRNDIPIEVGAFRDIEPIDRVELFANRPLDDGAEIIRADVTVTGPSPAVQVGGKLPFDAAFGANMIRLAGLSQIRDAVIAVLLELGQR
jgi:hypothetical protein